MRAWPRLAWNDGLSSPSFSGFLLTLTTSSSSAPRPSQVTGIDVASDEKVVYSVGFDRTFKVWEESTLF